MLEAGGVSMDSIGVMGTEADLADVREEADKLGAAYYKVWDSFNVFEKKGDEVPASNTFLTLQPTFIIKDLAKAEPFMKQCVDATRTESGCLYYGWTISDDGTKLFCREAYIDGNAVDTHLKNAVPIVGAMLASGAVEMESIELHGPKAEWAACKVEADKLGMVYFDVDASFAKFALPARSASAEVPRSPPPSPPEAMEFDELPSTASKARRASVSFRPEPTGPTRKLPPAWLHKLMSVIYPMSLGLLESVTQLLIKALVAILAHCSSVDWPLCCFANAWTWVFTLAFSFVGVWTVIWLKVVYTRFELTLGLPIEYGTVHVGSVLGGLIFYKESQALVAHQLVIIFLGLVIVLLGVALSSMKQFPWRAD